MILDLIDNAQRYYALHPLFSRAFEYLRSYDLTAMEPGRYSILGKKLFVIVSSCAGIGKNMAKLEAHNRYTDIQIVLAGKDTIGWKPRHECVTSEPAFDQKKDIGFFPGAPRFWTSISKGSFVIFFPQDAHAPLAGRGIIKKAVFKVLAKHT